MGGLLAAEAAMDSSNAPLKAGGKPNRIVGIIAFDVPFLGMHPHVVISGLASLLPKGESKGETSPDDEDKKEIPPPSPAPQTRPSERDAHAADKQLGNHPEINRVSSKVTDDWEDFKQRIDRECPPYSTIPRPLKPHD
jgi:hypothetical protein